MKKTLITLLIMPFFIAANAVDLSDANFTIGVGGAQYVSGVTGEKRRMVQVAVRQLLKVLIKKVVY